MDIEALDSLPETVDKAFHSFPSIDAVFIVAGKQNYYNFNYARPSVVPGKGTPDTAAISSEVTTNLTGNIILAREILKHAQAENRKDKPFFLAFVTSGLAFIPAPIFPVYCATKAALHSFIVSLRAQLLGTKVHTIEIAPPYVETDLDTGHLDVVEATYKGKLPPAENLKEYVQSVVRGMENTNSEGAPPNVVSEGFISVLANTWVDAFKPIAKKMGLDL